MSSEKLNIIFMGTPDFAVPSLSALIKGPDTVCAVVTKPDRPKGRGQKLVPPPVKVVAEENGIPVLQPDKIKTAEFANTLKSYAPDVIVVAAYGRILPPALLELPPHGCINVHGSLLPRHRGAAPIQWAIINGDQQVGVTIMQMSAGMDTGAIRRSMCIPADPGQAAGSLFPKSARRGSDALMDTLDMLMEGGLAFIPQDDKLATMAPMLSKTDGMIDWNRPAEELDCLIRGLDPWPSAHCSAGGKKLQLFDPEVFYVDSNQPPGTVIRADRQGLLVSTAKASLLIREVKPEGKRRMPVEAFLNGYKLVAGDRLVQGKR